MQKFKNQVRTTYYLIFEPTFRNEQKEKEFIEMHKFKNEVRTTYYLIVEPTFNLEQEE